MSFPHAVQAGDRPVAGIQHAGDVIGDESRRRADVGRIKPQRIKRRGRDRAEIGVGSGSGRIAVVVLVHRASPAEFQVAAGSCVVVHLVDRLAQIAGIDVQSLRQLLDGVAGDQISVGKGGFRSPAAGTHHAETVFPQRHRIRDQKRRDRRLSVGQHLQRELMVGDRFVDEAAAMSVDHQVPGLPRSSTKCGNTACDPSRRRRIEAGAQKAALRSRSLMRAPISRALSCASPFEPGATEDQSASVPNSAGRRPAWRLNPPPARIRPPSMPISRETPPDSRTADVTRPPASRTIFSSDVSVRMSTPRADQ